MINNELAAQVKTEVGNLISRRAALAMGAEPVTPGYNPAKEIQLAFEKLALQAQVSVAALEFFHNPNLGLALARQDNLTSAEKSIVELYVGYAQELKSAGLMD